MPLFVVSRTYQETSEVEDPEFGMVHFLAMAWNEPRYDWVRSFGRSSFGFCVYRGPDALELGIQQRLCRLDYDEVREVGWLGSVPRGTDLPTGLEQRGCAPRERAPRRGSCLRPLAPVVLGSRTHNQPLHLRCRNE